MNPWEQDDYTMKTIPASWTDWQPGKTQYSVSVDKPGDMLEVRIPGGAKYVRIQLFVPQGKRAGAAVRIGKWPECDYALNMTTEDFIALPWDVAANITIGNLKAVDCQVRAEGGIVTAFEGSIWPTANSHRLFVRFLPYDPKTYIYRASFMVQVDPEIYAEWWDAGRPLPAIGGPSGPCNPIWAEGSGSDPEPEPPEPDHECNPLMAAICAMKGLDCWGNECVEPDVPQEPEPSLVVMVKQPLSVEALGYDDLDAIRVNGLMPGPANIVCGLLDPNGKAFVLNSEGRKIRICPGDAVDMIRAEIEQDSILTSAFAGHEKPGRKYIVGVEQDGAWKWAAWRKA